MPSSGQTRKKVVRRIKRRQETVDDCAIRSNIEPEAAPLCDRLASVTSWRPGQTFPHHQKACSELALIEGVARTLSRSREGVTSA